MSTTSARYNGRLIGTGVVLAVVWGCSSNSTTTSPSVGGSLSIGGSPTGGAVNGGASATGGSISSIGGAASTGGEQATGGASTVGGSEPTGGAIATGGASTGGLAATGGKAAGGSDATGGKASGGAATGGAATGGKSAGGAATGGKSAGGGATGGAATGGSTSSGGCQKGQIKPAEVVIMGESFYAISPQYIETRIESDAQKAGALASGSKYRNVAVSGQNMNYIATTEWTNATSGGASVKNVIMDGGGIDCLNGGGSACTSCPDTFKTLLGKMVTAGVQDVIYTRYPEPGSPPGSNASLKSCLDATMPNMQTVCSGVTGLRCHWVDLRPVWQTNDVLSDGLHPTQSGGDHVGDLLWSEMVKDCMAQ